MRLLMLSLSALIAFSGCYIEHKQRPPERPVRQIRWEQEQPPRTTTFDYNYAERQPVNTQQPPNNYPTNNGAAMPRKSLR